MLFFNKKPAGILKRFLAIVFDTLIILTLCAIILLPLGYILDRVLGFARTIALLDTPTFLITLAIVLLFVSCIYFVLYESSAHQATPGKKMLGIYVATEGNQRVSKQNAIWRFVLTSMPGVLGVIFSALIREMLGPTTTFINGLIDGAMTMFFSLIWFLPIFLKNKGVHDKHSKTSVLSRK